MESLNVKKMIPDIYCQESRDFQLLCNLYGCIVNGIKFDSSSTYKTIDSKTCRAEFLQLLGTKLGFFPEKKFTADQLREALVGFKDLINNKGSLTGVAGAVHVFLKTLGIHNKIRISVTSEDIEFGGRLIKDHTVIVAIESAVTDTSLLTEIFKYIIPAGYEYIITFYTEIDPYDEFLFKEEVTLIYTSDSVNSVVGRGSSTWTNLFKYRYYDGWSVTNYRTVWEVNDDYTIHAVPNPESTSTYSSSFTLQSEYQHVPISAGTYFLCGCPDGGSSNTYYIQARLFSPGASTYTSFYDYGDGKVFTITEDRELNVRCYINYTFEDYDFTFKPMVVKWESAEDEPTEFIPPSTPDNRTLNLINRQYRSASHTGSGITWTVNSDGSVTVNGTNTDSREVSFSICTRDNKEYFEPGTYYLTGCPAGGSTSTYCIYSTWWIDSSGNSGYDAGNGFNYTIQESRRLDVNIQISSGATVNNLTFFPMLVKSDTMYPYTPPGTTVTQASMGDKLISEVGERVMGGVNDGEVISDTPYIGEQYNLIPFCTRYSTNPYTTSYFSYEIMNDGSVTIKPGQTTSTTRWGFDYFYQANSLNYLEFEPGVYRFSLICDDPDWYQPYLYGRIVTYQGTRTGSAYYIYVYGGNSRTVTTTFNDYFYVSEIGLGLTQDEVSPSTNIKLMFEKLQTTSDPIRPYQIPTVSRVYNMSYRGCVTNLNQIVDPNNRDMVTLLSGNSYYMYLNGQYNQKQYGGTYMGLGLIPEPVDDIIVFASGSNLYYWRNNNDWVPLNFRIKSPSLTESCITDPHNYDLVVTDKAVNYIYNQTLHMWILYNTYADIYGEERHIT